MQKVPPPSAPAPLLAHLVAALAPMPRGRVKELLRAGRVTVNGAAVTRHDHPLTPADAVVVRPAGVPDALGGVRVVREDARLVVADKPSGLLTVATDAEKLDTLFARLSRHAEQRKAGRVFVVHRLDRDTSGLVVFARTPDERDRLQAGWADARKTYLAVVHGRPARADGAVENHLLEGDNLRVRAVPAAAAGAKAARSRYRVRASSDRFALVEVELLTGGSTRFACTSPASAARSSATRCTAAAAPTRPAGSGCTPGGSPCRRRTAGWSRRCRRSPQSWRGWCRDTTDRHSPDRQGGEAGAVAQPATRPASPS